MVYGDPITVGDKTILPVAKIRYGFGAGSGSGSGVKNGAEQRGEGGGGGGGLIALPLGVVEVTASATRFVPIRSGWSWMAAAGIGAVVGLLFASARRGRR